jgi:hypothetical protein
MHKVGEIEGGAPNFADTNDFLNLIGKQLDQAELEDMWYIDRHLVFLKECGFISLGSSTYEGKRGVKLTAQGNMFLQPELAEFGNQSLLPDVIKALEERIQALTYPEEEKEGLLYRMREAVARQRGDFIVKIIMEIASRYAQTHG